MSKPATEIAETRLAAESIEALAARLAELLGAARAPERRSPPQRLLSAAEVAEWWGVERSWVYAHAAALGARRLGAGPRPRLRFDPDEVAEALGAPPADGRWPPDMRRSAAIADDRHPDSLSPRTRGTVAESERDGRGGARTPPGPAPKGGLRRDQKPSPAGPSRRRPLAAGRGGW